MKIKTLLAVAVLTISAFLFQAASDVTCPGRDLLRQGKRFDVLLPPTPFVIELARELDEGKIELFYTKSQDKVKTLSNTIKAPVKGGLEDLSREELNELLWLFLLGSKAPLFDIGFDELTPLPLRKEKDIAAKRALLSYIHYFRYHIDGAVKSYDDIKRNDLVLLLSDSAASIMGMFRSAYDPELKTKLGKIEEENKLRREQRMSEFANSPEFTVTGLIGGSGMASGPGGKEYANVYNKARAAETRNLSIKAAIGNVNENRLVNLLVACFPNKANEVKKYIKLAGYEGDEVNDLIDRTVGRSSGTEFLYKGADGRKHDRKVNATKKR